MSWQTIHTFIYKKRLTIWKTLSGKKHPIEVELEGDHTFFKISCGLSVNLTGDEGKKALHDAIDEWLDFNSHLKKEGNAGVSKG
jgi:hypothetical protein